ncbi:MAG: DUF3570 domain-containing protein [Reichenbachiella sp.]
MEENQVEDVDVTNMMRTYIIILFSLLSLSAWAQESDSTSHYKKRVLDATEIDLLFSYYEQDGNNSAVSGGVGNEHLTDVTPTIIVSMPAGPDGVLTIDAGISAYSSASSSNINPFNSTGASQGGRYEDDDDDDDDDEGYGTGTGTPIGSPWVASSGASKSDALTSLNVSYAHSSDDRNNIWNMNGSISREYDYSSFGFGGGFAKLMNQKNTELSFKAQVYLDQWNPIYPTELHEYETYGQEFLSSGFFSGVTVYDQQGVASTSYLPSAFSAVQDKKRNSYALSVGFSQILSRNFQISLFVDAIRQEGLLSTPYQRVYFADVENYFIGDTQQISVYESKQNTGVYQLADDVERLPSTRLKIPIGVRANYYLTEFLSLRTYYRYYQDDWGLTAHTASIELPIKIGSRFTFYPNYRYYEQNQADYFAPFDTHLSTEQYYTSDYDLSTFDSQTLGMGISYKDIFTSMKIGNIGLKSIDVRYQNYQRSNGLNANIVSFAFKFVVD